MPFPSSCEDDDGFLRRRGVHSFPFVEKRIGFFLLFLLALLTTLNWEPGITTVGG